MPRLQIDVPGQFHFSTEIAVYVGHINSGAHLDNVQLLTLYSEARRRFFARLGRAEWPYFVLIFLSAFRTWGRHGTGSEAIRELSINLVTPARSRAAEQVTA
jgi:hypothetical protein